MPPLPRILGKAVKKVITPATGRGIFGAARTVVRSKLMGESAVTPRSYWSDEALRRASRRLAYSDEKLIWMSPKDFLKLAFPLQKEYKVAGISQIIDSTSQKKLSNIRAVLDSGKKLNGIPYLRVTHDEQGLALVLDHEGRHRATVLAERGVPLMPVLLKSRTKGGVGGVDWVAKEAGGVWPKQVQPEMAYGFQKGVPEIQRPFLPNPLIDPRITGEERLRLRAEMRRRRKAQ